MSKRATGSGVGLVIASILLLVCLALPWWSLSENFDGLTTETYNFLPGEIQNSTSGTDQSYSQQGYSAVGGVFSAVAGGDFLAFLLTIICGILSLAGSPRPAPRNGLAAGVLLTGLFSFFTLLGSTVYLSGALPSAFTTDYTSHGTSAADLPPWAGSFSGSYSATNGYSWTWGPGSGWYLALLLSFLILIWAAISCGALRRREVVAPAPQTIVLVPQVVGPSPYYSPAGGVPLVNASGQVVGVMPAPMPSPMFTPTPASMPMYSSGYPVAPPPAPVPAAPVAPVIPPTTLPPAGPAAYPSAGAAAVPAPARPPSTYEPLSSGSQPPAYGGSSAGSGGSAAATSADTPAGDEVRQALREVVRTRGDDVLENPRLLRSLLSDECTGATREITLVVAALENGIPADLRSSVDVGGRVSTQTVDRLARRLMDDRGFTEAAARWSVESWAQALR